MGGRRAGQRGKGIWEEEVGGREGQVAPQCWVLMVETPLRLACAGHEGD